MSKKTNVVSIVEPPEEIVIPLPGAPPVSSPATDDDDAAGSSLDGTPLPKITEEVIAWCQRHGFEGKSGSGARRFLLAPKNADLLKRLNAELTLGTADPRPSSPSVPPEEVGQMIGMLVVSGIGPRLQAASRPPPGGSVQAFHGLANGFGAALAAVAHKYGWLDPRYGVELAAVLAAGTLGYAVWQSLKADPLPDGAVGAAWTA